MKRKVLALLIAASLVSASFTPAAADDFTIEMQSQDIAFDEPEFAEENPVVEDVVGFEEEDISNEEDSAAGFEEEDNEEDKTPSDDIVVEDSYDEDFAGEDETLAETQIENEELAEETVNLAEGSIPIDETHFPDPVFRNYIKDKFDDGDGYLSEEERYNVEEIELEDTDASSLAGIELFENLHTLHCAFNQLTSLDVSKCTMLEGLYCSYNQLTTIDLSQNTALQRLSCYDNQLTSLDVSQCTNLDSLNCYDNQLTSLDVSRCTKLAELNCSYNQLSTLDVSKCADYLNSLNCDNNQLTSLDVGNFTKLTELYCSENHLTNLDVELCVNLEHLECDWNQLTSVDVSWCYGLKVFYCKENQLTSLDVSECDFLTILYCNNNQLTSLNVSKCEQLRKLHCYSNRLTSLDLSNNPKLKEAFLKGEKDVDLFTEYILDTDDTFAKFIVDNTTKIIAYPEHDHIPQVSIPAKAATCTKAGKTAEETCSICGEILTAQETIPALGHKWGKWKTTKAATTTAEGKETRTCSRCGEKETRAIAKLPKKANPITVKSKSPSVSKTAKKAQTIKASDAFTIKNAQGTVTFKKKSGSSGKLSINSKTGLITEKNGTKAGTYKIVVAVTAAGNKQYKAGTKTVTVKVKVK